MKTMKRNLLPTLVLVMSLCSLFVMTSCEKEDTEEIITGNHSKEILGEYPSNCELLGVAVDDINTLITLKDDEHVWIETPEVIYGKYALPAMKLESPVKNTTRVGLYILESNSQVTGMYVNDRENTFPMKVQLKGEVNTINNTIDLYYSFEISGMPFKLVMHVFSK